VIATSCALGRTSNVAAAVGSVVVVDAGAADVVEAGVVEVGAAELPPELHAEARSDAAAKTAATFAR